MALRPLRNAMISFGLVSIPVRFYTATKSEDIHFNLLHASCGTRVNRKWWCPHHEKIVESDELIRGYAISKNKSVKFEDEEIEALETDGNRALDYALSGTLYRATLFECQDDTVRALVAAHAPPVLNVETRKWARFKRCGETLALVR